MDARVGDTVGLPARGRGRLPATMPTNTSVPNPTGTVINGSTSGPWRPRTDPQNAPRELRRPREAPIGLPTNTPISEQEPNEVTPACQAVVDQVVPRAQEETPTSSNQYRASILSPEAKEFVPRFRTTMPGPQDVKEFVPRSRSSVGSPHNVKEFVPRNRTPVDDLSSGGSRQFKHQQHRHPSSEGWQGSDDDVTPEQVAMNHLTEVMTHMSVNPGLYDTMARPLVDAFGSWLQDEETAVSVVSALFEQSVTDANFRFNGARLAHLLNNRFGGQFRSLLLNRCRHEHLRVPEMLPTDPGRVRGYLLLVAEMYVTLELTKGSKDKIQILGKAVLETISHLLAAPTHDNVKCVCQSLKLSGHHLSALDADQVDTVFARLHKIHVDRATAANTQLLILNLTNLRRENWGLSSPGTRPQPSSTVTTSPPPNGQAVFYGPDGMVLTQEESQFLQENVTSSTEPEESDSYSRNQNFWETDDGMNEEVEAAFEQFLLLGTQDSSH